jgi:hypothetical protein
MIDNLAITDLKSGNKIYMQKDLSTPYVLDDDGVSFGQVNASHTDYDNLNGVGTDIINTAIDKRQITITGKVCCQYNTRQIIEKYGVSKVSDIQAIRIKTIDENKILLSTMINPFNVLRIQANGYFIDVKPNNSIAFSDKWSENNEIYCKFEMSFVAANPMFKLDTAYSVMLSGVTPKWHFKWIINKFKFGTKISKSSINVKNYGDISTGGIITLTATGIVKNPKIINVDDQTYILINKQLQAGEVIKIDTDERTIFGSLDGINYENYYKYWDYRSKWFQFKRGISVFTTSADEETYKLIDIMITLNQEYYTIKGQ